MIADFYNKSPPLKLKSVGKTFITIAFSYIAPTCFYSHSLIRMISTRYTSGAAVSGQASALFARCFLFLIMAACLGLNPVLAQTFDETSLPKALTEEELTRLHEIGLHFTPTEPPTGTVRNIAEFERNEGALVRWPLWIPVDLVVAMSEHVTVTTLVSSTFQRNQATTAYQNAGANMENITFLTAPTNSVWTRDYGPFYIADENHQVSIVDFIYNRPRPLDDQIPLALANQLEIPHYGMPVVHTGGNYMTDGWNTSASTDLIWEENSFNEELVLQNMFEYLNTETYHVTIDPQQSAIAHIDTWAKFLDVDKILIARVPEGTPYYDDHELVADYFANAVSSWGTPYQVYRIDTPDLSPNAPWNYQPHPYTNSLILNERVYVPLMGTVHDQAAIEAYQAALPGYEILGFLNPGNTGWNSSDALHCRVKEIPDRGMLYMRHLPVTGTQAWQPVFELEVDLIPYSGAALIEESLLLHYRLDEGPWQQSALTLVSGHTWVGQFSPGSAQTVHYYFAAADESGRAETWPLIGEPGARSFQVDTDLLSFGFSEGWHLAGLPADLSVPGFGFSDIFGDAAPHPPLVFSGETEGYLPTETPAPGLGFWMELTQPVDALLGGSFLNEVTLELSEGWNLISGPLGVVGFDGAQQSAPQLVTGTLYRHGAALQRDTEIAPGRGYWLYAAEAGPVTLNPGDDGGRDSAPASEMLEQFTRLQFTAGDDLAALPLFFEGALGDEDAALHPATWLFPPAAPVGAPVLDARLAGDRWLAEADTVHISLRQPLDAEGAAIPVTLSLSASEQTEDAFYEILLFSDGELFSGDAGFNPFSVELPAAADSVIVFRSGPLSAPAQQERPAGISLAQNYPNPFNPATVIGFELPEAAEVRLEVYSLTGQRVATLAEGMHAAGKHTVSFNAGALASGIYLYRLTSGTQTLTRRMTLVK